jgi:purine-nucleoside phosphorylase
MDSWGNPADAFPPCRLGSEAMPTRLRPTAPIAADAVLVGDPGRALLLAQELLEEPKMSNHARGLWGYSGLTPGGRRLTIQATGIGGPSAALVLADLAELGVSRAIRVGTCVGLAGSFALGDLLVVTNARAGGGSTAALGVARGEAVTPDPGLTAGLTEELGSRALPAAISSFDVHPDEHSPAEGAADMQSASLLARARSLGVAAAAVLIVAETTGGGELGKDGVEKAERAAGRAASAVLSG